MGGNKADNGHSGNKGGGGGILAENFIVVFFPLIILTVNALQIIIIDFLCETVCIVFFLKGSWEK